MDDNLTLEGLGDLPATGRRCLRCKVDRPLDMFYVELERRESSRMGRRTRRPCRICKREENRRNLAERQEYVDSIKLAAGCADCGIRSEHPEIYDFDHRPGTIKVANVAALLTKGTIEELDAEITKCEVVCANCHRIRTRGRQSLAFGIDKPRPEETV